MSKVFKDTSDLSVEFSSLKVTFRNARGKVVYTCPEEKPTAKPDTSKR